jgi:hypothetical protein
VSVGTGHMYQLVIFNTIFLITMNRSTSDIIELSGCVSMCVIVCGCVVCFVSVFAFFKQMTDFHGTYSEFVPFEEIPTPIDYF